jgi:hypothetical protein
MLVSSGHLVCAGDKRVNPQNVSITKQKLPIAPHAMALPPAEKRHRKPNKTK